MPRKFDVIVIGTGAAALTVSHRCRSAGWEVAVIDSRPFGGTCAQRGCDPKKVLAGAAHLLDWHQRMDGYGLAGDKVRIDWPDLIRFKRSFTEPVADNTAQGFAEAGIDTFHGRASFVNNNTLQVAGERLQGRYVVIAAGAKATPLTIPGAHYLIGSTQFMELERLPARIVFVGGGYISFEFAHIAARAGARVTILHRSDRPLKGFDPDLVGQLVEASREAGIDLRLNAAVESVEKAADHFRVHSAAGTVEADLAVHGAGRVPEIDDLALEHANVERGKNGVTVNMHLQSVSNPAVYAAGDAASSGLPLTPVAGLEGQVVAANLLEGNHQQPDYRGITTVVFTQPPLAAVGLSEASARRQGLHVNINHGDSSGWYTSRRERLSHAGFKVLTDKDTGEILGAHLLGPHADEVINLFALAVRFRLKAADLKQMLFSYPTSANDIKYML